MFDHLTNPAHTLLTQDPFMPVSPMDALTSGQYYNVPALVGRAKEPKKASLPRGCCVFVVVLCGAIENLTALLQVGTTSQDGLVLTTPLTTDPSLYVLYR